MIRYNFSAQNRCILALQRAKKEAGVKNIFVAYMWSCWYQGSQDHLIVERWCSHFEQRSIQPAGEEEAFLSCSLDRLAASSVGSLTLKNIFAPSLHFSLHSIVAMLIRPWGCHIEMAISRGGPTPASQLEQVLLQQPGMSCSIVYEYY